MAFTFTKAEAKEFAKLESDFEVARDTLAEFVREKHSEWDDAFNEKSERWQEGEAGETARTKIDGISNYADEIENMETPDASDFYERD